MLSSVVDCGLFDWVGVVEVVLCWGVGYWLFYGGG